LYHRPGGGCAREIAERFGLKKAFTANVLKVLCKKGLVRGQRGLHGGYVLTRPAHQIDLADLLDQLGELFHLADCNRQTHDTPCSLEAVCPVRAAIAEVDRRIREMLQTVTLAELVSAGAADEGLKPYGLEVIHP